jgi:hypothetical protein
MITDVRSINENITIESNADTATQKILGRRTLCRVGRGWVGRVKSTQGAGLVAMTTSARSIPGFVDLWFGKRRP